MGCEGLASLDVDKFHFEVGCGRNLADAKVWEQRLSAIAHAQRGQRMRSRNDIDYFGGCRIVFDRKAMRPISEARITGRGPQELPLIQRAEERQMWVESGCASLRSPAHQLGKRAIRYSGLERLPAVELARYAPELEQTARTSIVNAEAIRAVDMVLRAGSCRGMRVQRSFQDIGPLHKVLHGQTEKGCPCPSLFPGHSYSTSLFQSRASHGRIARSPFGR